MIQKKGKQMKKGNELHSQPENALSFLRSACTKESVVSDSQIMMLAAHILQFPILKISFDELWIAYQHNGKPRTPSWKNKKQSP